MNPILNSLNTIFKLKVVKLLNIFQSNGIDFIVTSGRRTQAQQENLKKEGYPAVKNSLHLYGLALDISITDNRQRALAMKLAKENKFRAFDYPDHPKSKYALHLDDLNGTAFKNKKPESGNNFFKAAAMVLVSGAIVWGLMKYE